MTSFMLVVQDETIPKAKEKWRKYLTPPPPTTTTYREFTKLLYGSYIFHEDSFLEKRNKGNFWLMQSSLRPISVT